MNFLPIMERELQVVARRPGTYHARIFAALVVILMSLGMLFIGFGGVLSAMAAGRNLFLALSILAYGYVVLDGPFMTADCLSQEKREGTMGLLFLTNLKGYDIVAGKLVSRSANSAYCLLAALPALGVGIFLGGVTGGDFFRTTLALMNGLFFSVSFGMLMSALCRNERRAIGSALLGVLTLGILVPLLGFGLKSVLKAGSVHPAFLVASPAGAFLSALGPNFSGVLSFSFASSILFTHLMGWIFLALASVILPRAWQEKPAKRSLIQSLRSQFPQPLQNVSMVFGVPPSGASAAGPLEDGAPNATSPVMMKLSRRVENDPMLWMGERRGQKGLGISSILLLFVATLAAGYLFGPKNWHDLVTFAGSALVLHLVLMYGVAAQACRSPSEDRQSGMLELLLTTPLGEEFFLRGRMLSLKRQCLGPVLVVLAGDLIFIIVGCVEISAFDWTSIAWVAFFLILMAKLLADLYTLSWVGFWQGLKAKSTGGAIRQTIYYVGLLHWLILLGSVALIGLATQGAIFRSPATGVFVGLGYVALEIMTMLNFCGAAMSELKDDLRLLVMRYDETGGEKFSWWPFHFERRARVHPKLSSIAGRKNFGLSQASAEPP